MSADAPGAVQAMPSEGRRFEAIDPARAAGPDRYKLFMGSIVPRPIAFVSSLNDQGKVNLAPFSNFMAVSAAASLVAFSVGSEARPGEREKDTLHNVRAHGEFVINLASTDLAAQVQLCSGNYPPEVSEAEEAGLALVPSVTIATPRVAATRIQFECRLERIVDFDGPGLVVGKVLLVHAEEGLIRDYKIDPLRYAPLARLGGRTYATLGDLIHV